MRIALFSTHSPFVGGLLAVLILLPANHSCLFAQNPGGSAPQTPSQSWPQFLNKDNYAIAIYKPNIETWDGTTMKATVAVSVKATGDKDATFGAVHLSASALIDKADRFVYFEDVNVIKAEFPSAAEDKKAEFLKILTPVFQTDFKSISLDRFEAGLAVLEAEKSANAVPIENPPPQVIT